ncbi:leucine-rich repeat domain-containing protein [Treponema phagedenis]|uniref:leucine-rich repeat domain-containing protein n=1 Tax=Treponema phagedenis TaxID=162 RepID=UPI0012DBF5A7|nr:leucine-rich repeat domain-containing protein [Treponema phagedenis]
MKKIFGMQTLILIAAASVLFFCGCKKVHDKTTVSIMVKGDANVTSQETTITAVKNDKWVIVKTKLPTLTFEENYELDSWHLTDANGAVLKDNDTFATDTVIFAVSKRSQITVTIAGDANVILPANKTVTIDKGEKWATVKTKLPTLGFQENYELDKWVLSGSSDAIAASYAFNGEEILYAVSKAKGTPPPPAPDKITIAVKGDPNVTALTKTSIEADKGEKWATVKTKLPTLGFQENYELDKWVLSGSSDAIAASYAFNGEEILYAVSKAKGTPPPPAPDKITIAVKGDPNVTALTKTSIEEDKGEKWATVKTKLPTLGFKENYELDKWVLSGSSTAVEDFYAFNGEEILYAVSKAKGTPPPPAPDKITIAVKGDPNITALTKTSIEADKGEKWATVKTKLPTLTFKENYELDKWVLSGSSDAIVDSYAFNGGETIFAVAKHSQVTVTITGDSNVIVPANKTVTIDKGENWATVKTKLPTLGFKENYELDKWVLSGLSDAIADSYEFNGEETIFAVSKRSQVTITIAGDEDTVHLPTNKTFMVDKGSTLTEIKNNIEIQNAMAMVKPQEYYGDPIVWYLSDENGEKLEEYTGTFNADTTLYAVAKLKPTPATQFDITSDGIILEIKGDDQVLVIPEEINGTPVTAISINLNLRPRFVRELRLPKTLQHIARGAFDSWNITKLTIQTENISFKMKGVKIQELVLADTVKTIGMATFSNCSDIKKLTLPAGLQRIGSMAFEGCSGISALTLPDELQHIEKEAFKDCHGIKGELNLPAELVTLGYEAFLNCTGITGELRLPSKLKRIESSTFSGCKGITAVRFPSGLEKIDYAAFKNCSGIEEELELPTELQTIG